MKKVMKKVVFICYGRGFGDVIAATATIRKIIKTLFSILI